MSRTRDTSRRTVCQRFGSLVVTLTGAAGIIGSTSAVAGRERADESTATSGANPAEPSRETEKAERHIGVGETAEIEFYRGVVDRIVDGRFVVILLEEDGEVVDELVEPRDELPPVAESDRVLVVLEGGEFCSLIPLSNAEAER